MQYINAIIYILVFIGIYLIISDTLIEIFRSVSRRIYRKRKKNKLYDYIRKIYISIENEYDEKAIENKVYTFIFIMSILFLVFFVITFKFNIEDKTIVRALLYALVPSVIIAVIPFIALRVKLYRRQVKSSYEATIIISEILNQYNIYNKNIIAALDVVAETLDKNIICRGYIIRLAMKLKQYKTDEELEIILDEFIFSVNTEWIKLLTDSIYFSIVDGADITLSLNSILKQIKTADAHQAYAKGQNNEGFVMGKIFAPLAFAIMLYITLNTLDVKLMDYLKAQTTGNGLIWLISIMLLYVSSLVLEHFYNNKKYDV